MGIRTIVLVRVLEKEGGVFLMCCNIEQQKWTGLIDASEPVHVIFFRSGFHVFEREFTAEIKEEGRVVLGFV